MEFDRQLIEAIAGNLKDKNQTVSVAESVTGGFLQAAFTLAKDASRFFQGGMTAYNVGQKYRHLLIEPLHALSCDCVSKKIAEGMAVQVCSLFSSHYGLAITGYASRIPEKKIDSLFSYYAIATKHKLLESGILYSKQPEGLDTQLLYAHNVLQKFSDVLSRS